MGKSLRSPGSALPVAARSRSSTAVKGGSKLRRDVRNTKAQRLAVFESLVACRPNAALHVLVESSVHGVEPEDHSLADRTSFPSQTPSLVLLDGVLFRERQHDLIDAVHQRCSVLPAVTQDAFELLLSAFTLLPGFHFLPAVELA